MKRLLLPVLFLVLGMPAGNLAVAGDRDDSDRKKLAEEIDKRIEAKLKQFRRELLADIKEMIAGVKKDRREETAAKTENVRKHATAKVETMPRVKIESRPGLEFKVEREAGPDKPRGKAKVRIERDGKVWEKELDLEKDGMPFEFPDSDGARMRVLRKVIPQVEEFGKKMEKFGKDFGPEIEEFGKAWGPQMEKFGKRFGRHIEELEPGQIEKLHEMFKGKGGFDFREFFRHLGPRGRFGGGFEDEEDEDEEGPRRIPESVRKQAKRLPMGEGRGPAQRFVELRKEAQQERGRGDRQDFESLRKEKDALAKELKEIRKLLEKLVRERRQDREDDF